MPWLESLIILYFVIIWDQVQEKQDYRDILHVQDSHHDVQYVSAFLSWPNVCPMFEIIDFFIGYLIGVYIYLDVEH